MDDLYYYDSRTLDSGGVLYTVWHSEANPEDHIESLRLGKPVHSMCRLRHAVSDAHMHAVFSEVKRDRLEEESAQKKLDPNIKKRNISIKKRRNITFRRRKGSTYYSRVSNARSIHVIECDLSLIHI